MANVKNNLFDGQVPKAREQMGSSEEFKPRQYYYAQEESNPSKRAEAQQRAERELQQKWEEEAAKEYQERKRIEEENARIRYEAEMKDRNRHNVSESRVEPE